MNDWAIGIKASVTLCLGALSSVLGAGVPLAVFFIATALIDWLSGTACAMKHGAWTSQCAREGLWHKTGEFISLLVAAGVDILIHYLSSYLPGISLNYKACLLPLVCVWYICTELGSILENIGLMGAPIPKFLARMIEVLKGQIEKEGNEAEEEMRVEK